MPGTAARMANPATRRTAQGTGEAARPGARVPGPRPMTAIQSRPAKDPRFFAIARSAWPTTSGSPSGSQGERAGPGLVLAASRIQLSRIHRPVLDKYTFPVALLNVETGTFGQVNYGYLVAGAVIAMVPCVILYLTLQRYYVQGLTSGAFQG